MTSDFISLFKDTSIVSVIGVVELSKHYQILAKSSHKFLANWARVTAALYLVMSVPLGYLSHYLELLLEPRRDLKCSDVAWVLAPTMGLPGS